MKHTDVYCVPKLTQRLCEPLLVDGASLAVHLLDLYLLAHLGLVELLLHHLGVELVLLLYNIARLIVS